MSNRLFADLAWLPKFPKDFTAQCRALAESSEPMGVALRDLANHALSDSDLRRLAKVIENARKGGRSLAPLEPFRLGLVGNATFSLMAPAIVATAARHGLALECVLGGFDLAVQDTLDPASEINRAECDGVLVAVDHRGLPIRPVPGDAEQAAAMVDAALDHLRVIRQGIRANSKAFPIIQTLARPPETLFGSFDMALPGTMRRIVDQLNRQVADDLAGDYLFDVAGIAETVGLADWHDPTLWNLAKLPFASAFLPLYAECLCRLIAAIRGKSRRCLVLDLDDTLWAGTIGDVGPDGIGLARGDATGEAHLAVQQSALSFHGRGVALAVSSKNDDSVARQPFRQHPEMILKEDHIAVFQANWQDKASNMKAVADQLSLGLQSLAFLDDNPAERGLIRRLLPEVAVPELPKDPALFARTLHAAGYFEAVAFSDEDRRRNLYYQANAQRVSLQGQGGDLEAYLASLGMEIDFRPFEEAGRARIAQLIAKSNQYNLTTKRYSEVEIAEMERDPNCFTLQVRLVDIFGDNGMISVVICRPAERAWLVDTWLMSCRVLGRRAEYAVLQEILVNAQAAGAERLIGLYRPTERNRLVEDHYAKLGFALIGRDPDGSTHWELAVDGQFSSLLPVPIKIRRPESALP